MNELSMKVLGIMEESPLGDMSIFVLKKQCSDAGLDPDEMGPEDIVTISEKMRSVLPFFIGERADCVVNRIRRLT
jgi:hypothetical protein